MRIKICYYEKSKDWMLVISSATGKLLKIGYYKTEEEAISEKDKFISSVGK